jgi:hypothetical protein
MIARTDRPSASGSSDALACFQPPGPDGGDAFLVVALVLVGVALREVGDRLVKCIAVAQVDGDGNRVTGSGVRSRQATSSSAFLHRAAPWRSAHPPPGVTAWPIASLAKSAFLAPRPTLAASSAAMAGVPGVTAAAVRLQVRCRDLVLARPGRAGEG